MSCEVHVRFYERLGVRLPRPTHHVLDLWFHKKWRPNVPDGEAIIVRYADDSAPRRCGEEVLML